MLHTSRYLFRLPPLQPPTTSMRYATTASRLFLAFAILNLTLLAGCSSTRQANTSPEPQQATVQEIDEAYVERLRQKPPEELTTEEIAYLQLVEERQQARSQRTLVTLAMVGAVLTLVGAIVTVSLR